MWEFIKASASARARYQEALASLSKDRYTVQEAAVEASVHVKSMRKHIKEGKLEVSQPSPRKTWVHKSDLARYISSRVE